MGWIGWKGNLIGETMPRIKKRKGTTVKKEDTCVWGGPEKEGITQSLLGRFLAGRERFRLLVVEGLKPVDKFNLYLEYGNMWHECEEHHAAGKDNWLIHLQATCKGLMQKYRTEQHQVEKWYNVCRVQFPVYVEYWKKHPDVLKRTPLHQEGVFNVPYTLPSGRVVRLKGKWDSVDLIGKGNQAGIYLQENKTKSSIDEAQILRQLDFDLQTMIYLIALQEHYKEIDPKDAKQIKGVRYNVVRRPLSGGKGNIRQHKPTKARPAGESAEEYYNRLREIIKENPSDFFVRWRVEVSHIDIKQFKRQFLDNCLEQLCQWWDWVSTKPADPFDNPIHFRTPYIFNPTLQGRESELDEYMATGDTLGLQSTTELFPEL